ncbi:hypothetical protein JW905_11620 [bacterium]|nr:hypothetical protein [candidate division CSSED10-310 bacterium]
MSDPIIEPPIQHLGTQVLEDTLLFPHYWVATLLRSRIEGWLEGLSSPPTILQLEWCAGSHEPPPDDRAEQSLPRPLRYFREQLSRIQHILYKEGIIWCRVNLLDTTPFDRLRILMDNVKSDDCIATIRTNTFTWLPRDLERMVITRWDELILAPDPPAHDQAQWGGLRTMLRSVEDYKRTFSSPLPHVTIINHASRASGSSRQVGGPGDDTVSDQSGPGPFCIEPLLMLVLSSDGSYSICRGGLLKTPFRDVSELMPFWMGEAAMAIRRALAEHQPVPECANCPYRNDPFNRLLASCRTGGSSMLRSLRTIPDRS